jgi:hypothetical protein
MPGTSEPANTEPEAPTTANGAAPEEEDVRARFREALERKQAKARTRDDHADGSSKIHNTHGPVGGKRTFRRKSG